jgi:hypothetical protein
VPCRRKPFLSLIRAGQPQAVSAAVKLKWPVIVLTVCPSVDAAQAPAAAAAALPTEQVRVAVLGASGYTGEEVVRLLALHPSFKVTALTGDRQAGKVGSPSAGRARGAAAALQSCVLVAARGAAHPHQAAAAPMQQEPA